jgi:flagellar hook-length control protein FliK
MASALPSAQVLLGLPTPASQDQEATASNPGSLRFTTLTDQAQAPPVVQPGSSPAQPGPAAEVSALQPSTAAQAVLAESGASWKAASKPDDSSSPAEPLNASKASTADKATKTLDLQSIAQAPLLAPMKDAGDPTTLGKAQPPDAGPDKANVQPSTNPSATVFMTEALAAKPAPPPAPRAADGSELAALSALSRTTEPAAVAATSAPLAAAPPPSAPVLQIEGGLKWMLKGGAQEAELQLHPDSLGKVTIHLRVEDGQVHARLWVTEPGSVQAVQEGRPHLEQSLKEQGLQLGSFDLQQGNRPFQEAPSASSSREPVVLEATSARQEAPVALPVSILNPHHVELYA